MKMPLLIALTLGCSSTLMMNANAATATFTDLNDSHNASAEDARELFDIDLTSASDNTLTLGLSDFTASGSGIEIVALDTASFKVIAPEGYNITELSYSESGTRSIGDEGGVTVAAGTVVANGDTNDLGTIMGTSPTTDSGWALTTDFAFDNALGVQEMVVSVTNSLFAAGAASISKTAATFDVGLTASPVPVPPALGLLGSALVGMATIRGARRPHKQK